MRAREWLQLLPAMALVYWFGRAQIDLRRQQEFISASSDLAELSPGASLGPVSHSAQPANGYQRRHRRRQKGVISPRRQQAHIS